jgi:hypothetical protein
MPRSTREDAITGRVPTAEHTCEVRAEQRRCCDDGADEDGELQPVGAAHQSRSGASSAYTRYASSATASTSPIAFSTLTAGARPRGRVAGRA